VPSPSKIAIRSPPTVLKVARRGNAGATTRPPARQKIPRTRQHVAFCGAGRQVFQGDKPDPVAYAGGRSVTSLNRRKRSELLVLVVEDDADARAMYLDFLTFTGFRVRVVANAEDAVLAAAESSPDLVLMDVGLPGADGFEATARVRAVCPTARVIFITGQPNAEGRFRAAGAGAVAFFAKPFVPEELVRVLDDAVTAG